MKNRCNNRGRLYALFIWYDGEYVRESAAMLRPALVSKLKPSLLSLTTEGTAWKIRRVTA